MKFGLNKRVLKKIREVLVAFPALEEAIIYGSRAIGTFREGSDIDLTLKGDLSFEDLLQIQVELDDKMLPYTFDISLYHQVSNEDLLEHINRAGKSLYSKKALEGKM